VLESEQIIDRYLGSLPS